jgi:carbon storage regulator
MLILTRRVDQSIVISGNIRVRVLGINRGRVTIGISAPVEVSVLREEVFARENNGQEPATEDERHVAT